MPNIETDANYDYDELGQLIKDKKEQIVDIDWRVDGKIRQIVYQDNHTLRFTYDAMGNRVAKKMFDAAGNSFQITGASQICLLVYYITVFIGKAIFLWQQIMVFTKKRILSMDSPFVISLDKSKQ